MATIEELKEQAAREAVREVKSGQVLGLGTGSTSRYAVIAIGERLRAGELSNIVGVPTSEATRKIAEEWKIPLAPLEKFAHIDLAIDGADEVDPQLDLIKGLGGALLREKAVEIKAKRFLVVADEGKLVTKIGTKAPVPVEVPKDRWQSMVAPLEALGAKAVLRGDATAPKITDGGNYILDCRFERGIDDAYAIAKKLDEMKDVLAHGLFLNMASEAIIAGASGVRRVVRASSSTHGIARI